MSKINGFELISPDKWRFLNNAEVEQAAQRAAEFHKRNFHFDNLEYHIEEYLRQWGLAQLIERYGYPENWLWLSNASKRNANIVIKDESNRSLALVAARYFGESDLDFEQAGHELQSDLEDIETVRFGIVTDGRRIAFLCKTSDDQIGDYQTIADFPEFKDLKRYVETNQLPDLPPTTQRFQKLPAPKRPAKLKSVAPLGQLADKSDFPIASGTSVSNNFSRRTIAAILGAVLLVLLGAWYITRSEPRVNGQDYAAETNTKTEKDSQTNVKTSVVQTAPQIRSSGNSVTASRRQRSGASKHNESPSGADSNDSLKLNSQEFSVMQTRSLGASPSSRTSKQSKAVTPPPAVSAESSNRKIIKQPFVQ